ECDDGNPCTDDSCDPAAGCANPNNPAPCDDGDSCTDDACDSALGCHSMDNSSDCDDGNACTTSDTCAGGACVGGAAPDCDDGNVCTDDSCDPSSGCVTADNEEACEDGDPCTGTDSCVVGACLGVYLVDECCGDPDSSGGVGVSDALRILQNAVGMDVVCPLALCDVNGNGVVTSSDALMTLIVAVGGELEMECSLLEPLPELDTQP
ncbi:MAG: hypothetical protein HRT46_12520, partial [Deltaproteobacteria bacterium]|nr:hypothetical protein [Deltaproteobacteria bacterium]